LFGLVDWLNSPQAMIPAHIENQRLSQHQIDEAAKGNPLE
jgi:hypothetical protein